MSSLKNTYYRVASSHKAPFSRSFTDDGTRDGSFDMSIDASLTPADFWVAPDPDDILSVQSLKLIISDTGAPASGDYGGIIGGLTNGLKFFLSTDGVKEYLSPTILTNEDVVRLSRTFDIFEFGAGARVLSYGEIYADFSEGIFIDDVKNQILGIELNDNFSTLVTHSAQVKGWHVKSKF